MTRTFTRFSTVALCVLAGCTIGLNEDNYPERSAAATCDFYQRCLPLSFWDEWDDQEECIDDSMDAWEDAEDYYDDCDFERGDACVLVEWIVERNRLQQLEQLRCCSLGRLG